MYDNPQAYPQMFPCLFPYGLGGIGQKCHFAKISESTQKRKLLVHHDKHFGTDFYFPMKAGVMGSFLLTKKKMWPGISNCLKSLNHDILKHISDKLLTGAQFKHCVWRRSLMVWFFFIIAYSKLGLEVLLLRTFETTKYDFIKIKFDYLWTTMFGCAYE